MLADLKPSALLFDFYETLLDIWTDENDPYVWEKLALFLQYRGMLLEGQGLKQSYDHLVRQHLEQSSEPYAEVSVYEIFRTLLSGWNVANFSELLTITVQLYRALSIRRFQLFEDTIPTLQRLRQQYRLALVTDAQRVFFEAEIRITGLAPFFEVMIVSSDYGFHKPDPRIFQLALKELGVEPGQALYVGDSWQRDMVGAQSAGIRTILLNRKNHTYHFGGQPGPDAIVGSLDELRYNPLLF
jgi:putative hydrolase of the HAD superfamily